MMRYAKVDTQSSRESRSTPTTEKQKELGWMLYDELCRMSCEPGNYHDVEVNYYRNTCIVIAKIKANMEGGTPVGLIAHMDVSPDAPSEWVMPRVVKNYDGGDIILNEGMQIVMHASEFENLAQYVGQDLIVTDGTTLLGGDDKASIASMMTMAEYYITHPEVKHGLIVLAFTPDEEVGGLAKDLDLEAFEAKAAYTLDGDHLGYYIDETFNAYAAKVWIQGRSVHPGTAKGKMINAIDVAQEFLALLPEKEKPQYTEGREGFFHVHGMQGTCESATIEMILRDFDADGMEARIAVLENALKVLNDRYGEGTVEVELTEEYRNMKEIIDTVPYLVSNLKQAIADCGIEPKTAPFRGGTDGSALTWRGLPCPNLSAGYENAHGRFEYVPIQSMEKNVEILIRLCELYAGI
ncbi:MAG: peptidase T [Lachnospiraceae bacterium]|nr:peptidase T [Lachnospiraceae bacterium]